MEVSIYGKTFKSDENVITLDVKGNRKIEIIKKENIIPLYKNYYVFKLYGNELEYNSYRENKGVIKMKLFHSLKNLETYITSIINKRDIKIFAEHFSSKSYSLFCKELRLKYDWTKINKINCYNSIYFFYDNTDEVIAEYDEEKITGYLYI